MQPVAESVRAAVENLDMAMFDPIKTKGKKTATANSN